MAAIVLIAGWYWLRTLFPPYHSKAALFFFQHQQALDAAADWIQAEGIDRLSVLPDGSVWAAAAGITEERRDEAALRHAEVVERAVRTPRGIRFNTGSFTWDGHHFLVAAIRLVDGTRVAPACQRQWEHSDRGTCAYRFAERWYLEYRWILADQE